jgi:hypothetical protein
LDIAHVHDLQEIIHDYKYKYKHSTIAISSDLYKKLGLLSDLSTFADAEPMSHVLFDNSGKRENVLALFACQFVLFARKIVLVLFKP